MKLLRGIAALPAGLAPLAFGSPQYAARARAGDEATVVAVAADREESRKHNKKKGKTDAIRTAARDCGPEGEKRTYTTTGERNREGDAGEKPFYRDASGKYRPGANLKTLPPPGGAGLLSAGYGARAMARGSRPAASAGEKAP